MKLWSDEHWELIDTQGIGIDKQASMVKKGINRSFRTDIKIQMVRTVVADFVNKINDFRRQGRSD